VFSSAWSEADAGKPVGPTLTALGLSADLGAQDDSEAARLWVRALDQHLDAWQARRAETASPEAQELLDGLQLVAIYRSRLLLDRAREALKAEHPRQALAFAQLALDVEHARSIGPLNPPGLFAVLALANLETGRTREALDALEVLSASDPRVRGLDETLGDLAVLEGIGRDGDSKEN